MVTFEKDFATEGESIEINENVALDFSKSFMTINIYTVNRETLEEKLSETIKINLSCMLFPKDNCDVSFRIDHIKQLFLVFMEI